jgi:hypothetical protein
VGLFNPAGSAFFLQNSHSGGPANVTFFYGPANAGWAPIAGDWNGDGTDTVGLHNPTSGGFFLRNSHSAGPANTTFLYGPANAGWLPIAGDWNGDGTDSIGLVNPTASRFYLKNSHAAGAADITFAYGPEGAGWRPLAGDWNGPSSGGNSVAIAGPDAPPAYAPQDDAIDSDSDPASVLSTLTGRDQAVLGVDALSGLFQAAASQRNTRSSINRLQSVQQLAKVDDVDHVHAQSVDWLAMRALLN